MPILESTFCEVYPGCQSNSALEGDRFIAEYYVETDDPTIQAQQIENWFKATHVNYGDTYSYGSDLAPTGAVALAFNVRHKGKDARKWTITVNFETPTNPAWYRLSDGKVSRNPLEWRPLLFTRTGQYSKVASKMYYEGGYSPRVGTIIGGGVGDGIGTYTVPINSALQPFSPPPEVDESLLTIIVEGNLALFNDGQDSLRYVNDQAITFDYLGFTRSVGKWGARMSAVTITPKQFAAQFYWFVRFEMEIRDDVDGWAHLLIDKGDNFSACPGQADGRGGVYGQGAGQTPVIEGRPEARRASDSEGEPITSEYLLDGDGQPLNVCTALGPVSGTWRGYEEKDFSTIPLISDVLA